jgi:hypothetical protein
MDKKTFTIGILTITALLLFLAQFMPLAQTAVASDSVRDRDWQIVSTSGTQGGDAIYIADARTGLVAVYTWDAGDHAIKLRAVKPIASAILQ